jgi:copper resistance protein B
MPTKLYLKFLPLFLMLGCSKLFAADMAVMSEDEISVFHRMRLELGIGSASSQPYQSLDLDGWIGSDENKLWVKSELEVVNHHAEKSNIWMLYSRNVDTFWDAQVGLRIDETPKAENYFVVGVNGLAPYFFETEAHFLIGQSGDIGFRLKERNEFLVTQRLIVEPSAEIILYGQSNPSNHLGAGLSRGEFSLQTRYEITRKFAPYLELKYDRDFGQTASLAKQDGRSVEEWIAQMGLRLQF